MAKSKKTKVVVRFNGIDTGLVDDIATAAGRSPDAVVPSYPARPDLKSTRRVTSVEFECETQEEAHSILSSVWEIPGVENFVEGERPKL